MPIPGTEAPIATPPTGPSALSVGSQPGLEAQAMLKVRQAAITREIIEVVSGAEAL